MHSCSGTYALILSSSVNKSINIGKLGTLLLEPGFYIYIGSAFGPGGLKARIKHHINNSSRPHWHIDYLSPVLNISEIWLTDDQVHREHQWAKIYSQTRRVFLPLMGFGSSDCRCPSHLFFNKSKPSGNYFRRKIRAKFHDHARFMIGYSDVFY